MPAAVEHEQERVVGQLLATGAARLQLAGEVHADHPVVAEVPVDLRELPPVAAQPREVLGAAGVRGGALEVVRPREHRVAAPQVDHAGREREQVALPGLEVPVHPRDLVVLAVGVVVPALRAAHLVARGEHRHPGAQQQHRQQVADLALAQGVDVRVLGLALDTVVPRAVVVRAVAVVLLVDQVVLVRVGRQIAQGEAVVRGDEVDGGERRATLAGVQVGRAGQPPPELRQRSVPTPVVARAVAELVVPLGPQRRELPDLVATGPDVPRLGDQLGRSAARDPAGWST